MRRTQIFAGFGSLLCAAAVLAFVFAGSAPATFAGHNGRIAFTGCISNSCDIYTVNPDGTALRRITHNRNSFNPAWSPNGKRIAYASGGAIWIVDANGGKTRRLTRNQKNAQNVWPRFMPNGKTILYTNCLGPSCDGGISAINVDGTGQHAILPNSGNSYNLAVPSRDGKQIAYMRWHQDGVMMGIYLLRLGDNPRHERRLTPPGLEAWAPDWSPDGSKIVFSSNLFARRPNGAIYSLSHLNGHGRLKLTQLTQPRFPLEDSTPAYSPDGSQIVFASDRRHPKRQGSDLFTMRADGSHLQPVHATTPGMARLDPQWGPASS